MPFGGVSWASKQSSCLGLLLVWCSGADGEFAIINSNSCWRKEKIYAYERVLGECESLPGSSHQLCRHKYKAPCTFSFEHSRWLNAIQALHDQLGCERNIAMLCLHSDLTQYIKWLVFPLYECWKRQEEYGQPTVLYNIVSKPAGECASHNLKYADSMKTIKIQIAQIDVKTFLWVRYSFWRLFERLIGCLYLIKTMMISCIWWFPTIRPVCCHALHDSAHVKPWPQRQLDATF